MKKSIVVALIAVLAIACLAGCSSAPSKSEPLDLTGTWKQTNSTSTSSYQQAVIEGDTITINWVSNNGDTQSLYWAGSYNPPTEATDNYTWDSVNNKELTSKAMLASNDDTKTITYQDKTLSYSASALGTTTTIKLEKQ